MADTECDYCGERHRGGPERCQDVPAALDGVTTERPEGSTTDPSSGLLWGEKAGIGVSSRRPRPVR